MGHVFWDQDTWMFPPILLLHSDIGRLLVDTRIRTLETARLYASQKGYRGARYPWESGFTGISFSFGTYFLALVRNCVPNERA